VTAAPRLTAAGTRLAVLIAGTAGAILFTEIVLTRLLSVLLFYHYSFLAISIALFGLAFGGLLAARRPLGDDTQAFTELAWRRLVGAAGALVGLVVVLTAVPPGGPDGWRALGIAVLAGVPLTMLGEVLARALAIGRDRIDRPYAVDLAAIHRCSVCCPLLAAVQPGGARGACPPRARLADAPPALALTAGLAGCARPDCLAAALSAGLPDRSWLASRC
jgi:hypothetical protein